MHIFGVVLLGPERGFETNSGGHVERQWTSSLEVNFAHRFASNVTYFPRMCPGSMTPGSKEGIGVDGRRNPSRKLDGGDEEESGEQASEERSTKGDIGVEILNPSATGLSPGSAPVLPASPPNRTGQGSSQHPQTSTEPAPPFHDQHHFLRSSVRPPSKRIRKDSVGSAINGHSGAKSKGTVGILLKQKYTQMKSVHRWVWQGVQFKLYAVWLSGIAKVVLFWLLCTPLWVGFRSLQQQITTPFMWESQFQMIISRYNFLETCPCVFKNKGRFWLIVKDNRSAVVYLQWHLSSTGKEHLL